MKAVVAAFNQEKALVGAFSVITNLRMELLEALLECDEMLCLQDCVVIRADGLWNDVTCGAPKTIVCQTE